jgi:hypothetical protein
MVGMSGAGAAAADLDASVVFFLFLEVMVLVLHDRFPLINSLTDGASQPIRGLSIIGA